MPESITVQNCTLRLIQQDITDFEAEAIVFYARPDLALGAGFGSAITRRGGPAIKDELNRIGSINPTDAVITTGGQLKAKYIVHAAGPVFQEEQLEEKLQTTIVNTLRCAEAKGVRQIAFPPMGAGFYGVPLSLCADLMISAIKRYLTDGGVMQEIILCANDPREYRAFQKVFEGLYRKPAAPEPSITHTMGLP